MASCCSWPEFKSDVKHYWASWGNHGEIDWDRAKEAWKKYCATPGEFVQHCEREYREKQARLHANPPSVSTVSPEST